MSQLQKAKLQAISSDSSREPEGDEVDVQFNPTSLKVNHSNTLEGGRGRSRQRRQYIASSSSVLTLELHFDTADEGSTDEPRSVQEKTDFVKQFVLPKEAGKKEVPPKLRFSWGELVFEGIVEKLDIDFDHFGPDGTPLRAKVNLSIKEQDATFQFLQAGPGARSPDSSGNANPGATNDGGGADPSTEQAAPALEDETPAEFAARMGLDPAAWRGLDVDLGLDLSLEAGIDVGFSAGLSLGAGVGIGVGIEAGLDLSLEASFGLEASAGVSAGFSASFGASVDADLAAGFSLSAAGGLNSAIESVQIAKSGGAVNEALESFGAQVSGAAAVASPSGAASGSTASGSTSSRSASPSVTSTTAGAGTSTRAGGASSASPGLPSRPARPQQDRTPLADSGPRSASRQASAAGAPAPPRVDARAATYGFGVPLRPRAVGGASVRSGAVSGAVRLGPRTSPATGLEFSTDPTVPSWEVLPARDEGRRRGDALDRQRRSRGGCGCPGTRGG